MRRQMMQKMRVESVAELVRFAVTALVHEGNPYFPQDKPLERTAIVWMDTVRVGRGQPG